MKLPVPFGHHQLGNDEEGDSLGVQGVLFSPLRTIANTVFNRRYVQVSSVLRFNNQCSKRVQLSDVALAQSPTSARPRPCSSPSGSLGPTDVGVTAETWGYDAAFAGLAAALLASAAIFVWQGRRDGVGQG